MASSKAGRLLSKFCNLKIVKDGRMYFELQNWAPTFLGKYGDDLARVKVPGRGYIGEDYLQVFLNPKPVGSVMTTPSKVRAFLQNSCLT